MNAIAPVQIRFSAPPQPTILSPIETTPIDHVTIDGVAIPDAAISAPIVPPTQPLASLPVARLLGLGLLTSVLAGCAFAGPVEYVVPTITPATSHVIAGQPQEVTRADLLTQPLRRGMHGDPVRRLQEGLARFVPVQITGDFDPQTEEAVRAFQTANQIKPDGEVGNYTFAQLWTRSFWEKGVVLELNAPAPLPADVKLRADLSTQRLHVMHPQTDEILRTFPISSGSSTYPTPRGSFSITQIREKPTWYPPKSGWAADAHVTGPGPGNPLGPAAMRLNELPILFHGVPRNEWGPLGRQTAASHGCMRMYPQDAWALHTIVKRGTPVEVR